MGGVVERSGGYVCVCAVVCMRVWDFCFIANSDGAKKQ